MRQCNSYKIQVSLKVPPAFLGGRLTMLIFRQARNEALNATNYHWDPPQSKKTILEISFAEKKEFFVFQPFKAAQPILQHQAIVIASRRSQGRTKLESEIKRTPKSLQTAFIQQPDSVNLNKMRTQLVKIFQVSFQKHERKKMRERFRVFLSFPL